MDVHILFIVLCVFLLASNNVYGSTTPFFPSFPMELTSGDSGSGSGDDRIPFTSSTTTSASVPITFPDPKNSPTTSTVPMTSAAPTTPPTTSAAPSTSPTFSAAPTTTPTTSAAPTTPPTTSAAPTTLPTTSTAPTTPPTTSAALTTPPTTSAALSTTAAASCNQTITLTVGSSLVWTTPNYPRNYDVSTTCHIQISGPADYAILVQFSAFSLEAATYCNYDYLEVYDGSSTSASLLGQYCGTSNPASVSSSSNAMYLVFQSDFSIVSTGISASLSLFDVSYPKCKLNYTEYAATSVVQTFSPTTVGGRYRSNADEYFLVTKANAALSLILQLTSMNVEAGTNCVYDRIVIYDGGCTSFNDLYTHCGTLKARWELPNNEYLVHFHTDSTVQKSGFTMEYFTGVAGTGAPTTTTTTVGAPVTEEINLVNSVLNNYTAVNSPRRDFTVAISSTVNLALVGINDLDEVEQALTTTVAFDISWKDDYMEWPTSKAAGISSLLIPQNDVWKPDITLMNGVEKITQMGASFMFVQVLNNGTCRWKPYQILKSVCNTAMSKYPYDIQKCDIKFSTWSSSGSDVTTVIGPEGMAKHTDFVENSEWTLLEIAQSTEVSNGKNVAVFTLTVQRNQAFVVFYVAIPVVMLSILNVFTFALPVSSGEKSGFGMTVFLSFVVYLIVTFQKLPENSEKLSIFAIYLLLNSMLSAITVMISCLEIRMIVLSTKNRPLGPCARKFSSFIINLQMKLLRIDSKVKEIRNSEQDSQSNDDDDAWPNFVSALDFVCFIIFTGVTVFIMIFFMVYLAT